MAELIIESVLTCPECGHARREGIPTAACRFFYECESCKTILRPKPGAALDSMLKERHRSHLGPRSAGSLCVLRGVVPCCLLAFPVAVVVL